MKITKFVHSCLLVESAQRMTLFDPGMYSYETFNLNMLAKLDDIIITHEHPDHYHLPFIQALHIKFPNVSITTTKLVADQLAQQGFFNVRTASSDGIELEENTHESMEPLAPPPNPNLVVHYMNQLTHPGDSHHFNQSKQILALPVNAPWGTWARAATLGTELKPQFIIPIHDWHLNDIARKQLHDRLETYYNTQGIKFMKIVDGQTLEFKDIH